MAKELRQPLPLVHLDRKKNIKGYLIGLPQTRHQRPTVIWYAPNPSMETARPYLNQRPPRIATLFPSKRIFG